jgi:hypothetical protein
MTTLAAGPLPGDDKNLSRLYPSVNQLLIGTSFNTDWRNAVEIVNEGSSEEAESAFIKACRAKQFKSNELMKCLGTPRLTSMSMGASLADSLDQDLAALIAATSVEQVKGAFAKKLLNDAQFEDVRYEIGIAATSLGYFDVGTISFEQELTGSKKNSDLCGRHLGRRCRIEVRVIHDDWPLRLSENFEDRLNGVEIPVGYSALLRNAVQFEDEVNAACKAIRSIYERRNDVHEGGLEIEDWNVYPGDAAHKFVADGGPICDIEFHPYDMKLRMVEAPAGSRSTMDSNEWSEIRQRNPKGVLTTADIKLDPRTHKTTPLSTVIWQRLDDKRKQCEPGAVNIIALGIPLPAGARHVEDAVTGAVYASISVSEGKDRWCRTRSGPFVPSETSKDVEALVDPFRIVSAVWAIRLSETAPESRVFRNPNAGRPINCCSAKLLELLGTARCQQNAIPLPIWLQFCLWAMRDYSSFCR